MAILFMLIPVIGGQFEANMPALGATSNWNASYNTRLTTGATFWTGLSPFIFLAALVAVAFIIIYRKKVCPCSSEYIIRGR